MNLEAGAASALVGVSLWQLYNAYTNTAPDLKTVRAASNTDSDCATMLRDTEISVGTFAILAGVAMSWLMRSWIPALLLSAGFLVLSIQYHSALNRKGLSNDYR